MSNGKTWRVRDAARNLRRAKSKELRYKAAKQAAAPTKNWKHMYTRSAKVARARQLGFEYPRRSRQEDVSLGESEEA